MMERNAALIQWIIGYHGTDAALTEHMLKVYGYAQTIGTLEGLDADLQAVLEAAAIVHDIGIPESLRKYGSAAGNYQEKEGPPVVIEAMKTVGGFSQDEQERICYLVAHHHTYENVAGLDYVILLEADFLVNSQNGRTDISAVKSFEKNVFRTETGIKLLRTVHGLLQD